MQGKGLSDTNQTKVELRNKLINKNSNGSGGCGSPLNINILNNINNCNSNNIPLSPSKQSINNNQHQQQPVINNNNQQSVPSSPCLNHPNSSPLLNQSSPNLFMGTKNPYYSNNTCSSGPPSFAEYGGDQAIVSQRRSSYPGINTNTSPQMIGMSNPIPIQFPQQQQIQQDLGFPIFNYPMYNQYPQQPPQYYIPQAMYQPYQMLPQQNMYSTSLPIQPTFHIGSPSTNYNNTSNNSLIVNNNHNNFSNNVNNCNNNIVPLPIDHQQQPSQQQRVQHSPPPPPPSSSLTSSQQLASSPRKQTNSTEEEENITEHSKLKPSSLSATKIKIGDWENTAGFPGDIVAKFYFTKRQFVWEFLTLGLKSKMVMGFNDITALKVEDMSEEYSNLTIEISKLPKFYKESNPQPKKNTTWNPSSDFTTNQEASTFRRHTLSFKKSLLFKNITKLQKCDISHLKKLIDNQVFSTTNIYFGDAPPIIQQNTPLQSPPQLLNTPLQQDYYSLQLNNNGSDDESKKAKLNNNNNNNENRNNNNITTQQQFQSPTQQTNYIHSNNSSSSNNIPHSDSNSNIFNSSNGSEYFSQSDLDYSSNSISVSPAISTATNYINNSQLQNDVHNNNNNNNGSILTNSNGFNLSNTTSFTGYNNNYNNNNSYNPSTVVGQNNLNDSGVPLSFISPQHNPIFSYDNHNTTTTTSSLPININNNNGNSCNENILLSANNNTNNNSLKQQLYSPDITLSQSPQLSKGFQGLGLNSPNINNNNSNSCFDNNNNLQQTPVYYDMGVVNEIQYQKQNSRYFYNNNVNSIGGDINVNLVGTAIGDDSKCNNNSETDGFDEKSRTKKLKKNN